MNDDLKLSPLILEVKRDSVDTKGMFTGYASTFGGPPDSVGDIIDHGAFNIALKQHKENSTTPAMLWSHDVNEPIGKWLRIEEDQHGLHATGKLTLGTKRGSEAYALLKDNAIGLSIGFSVARGGTRVSNSVRYIKTVALLAEVSLVAVPANTRAQITSIKSKPTTRKEFEHLLRKAGGLSVQEAKRVTYGGWGNLVRQEQDSTDLDQILSEIQGLRNDIRTR